MQKLMSFHLPVDLFVKIENGQMPIINLNSDNLPEAVAATINLLRSGCSKVQVLFGRRDFFEDNGPNKIPKKIQKVVEEFKKTMKTVDFRDGFKFENFPLLHPITMIISKSS